MKPRHEEFRRVAREASTSSPEDGRQAWLHWSCRTPERLRHEIFLFDDRTYLVTVRRPDGDEFSGPDRVATGTASVARWKALLEALDNPEIRNRRAAGKRSNARIEISYELPGLKAELVSFDYANHEEALPEVRLVDERIAELIEASDLKPPRRYARIPPPLRYDEKDIAALIRGLETDRPALFPHAVGELAAIGKPALPELERVLMAAEPRGAVARARIESVLEALEAFPESHRRIMPKVRDIAATSHPNIRRDPLVKRAADFVDSVVIRDFQREALARRGIAFAPSAIAPAPPVRGDYEKVMSRPKGPGLTDRDALARELEALGPDIVPLILESLDARVDAARSGGLVDALGGIGGPDAILYALYRSAPKAEDGVRSLIRLGEPAIPALLFLLEHGKRYTGSAIVTAFHRDEIYRITHPCILAMMERQRTAFRKATEEALRRLHRDGARNLVELLMAWDAKDPQSVQAVLDTALDAEQHDSLRGAALRLLRRIGSPAAQVAGALQERVGYESGSLRSELIRTVQAVGGRSAR